MAIIRYEDWSQYARGANARTHPIGSTLGVTLHWEGPHMGAFPHAECADRVRSIQRFHRLTRRWADIAYNAVVCPHGDIFEGRGLNTTSAANGDTVPNADWYAVCYLGGEGDGFTEEGKAGFREAVAWLRREGGAGPRVNGHRDHKATSCPGDEIYAWLNSTDFDTTQEDEMTPAQEALLKQVAADVTAIKKALGPKRPIRTKLTRLNQRLKGLGGDASPRA